MHITLHTLPHSHRCTYESLCTSWWHVDTTSAFQAASRSDDWRVPGCSDPNRCGRGHCCSCQNKQGESAHWSWSPRGKTAATALQLHSGGNSSSTRDRSPVHSSLEPCRSCLPAHRFPPPSRYPSRTAHAASQPCSHHPARSCDMSRSSQHTIETLTATFFWNSWDTSSMLLIAPTPPSESLLYVAWSTIAVVGTGNFS